MSTVCDARLTLINRTRRFEGELDQAARLERAVLGNIEAVRSACSSDGDAAAGSAAGVGGCEEGLLDRTVHLAVLLLPKSIAAAAPPPHKDEL